MTSAKDSYLVGSPNDLDDSLYKLDEEEIVFLASQTGIKDPIELKKHVVGVQHEAYSVCDAHRE